MIVCSGDRLGASLPAPAEQTQCAEAGGEERKGCRQGHRREIDVVDKVAIADEAGERDTGHQPIVRDAAVKGQCCHAGPGRGDAWPWCCVLGHRPYCHVVEITGDSESMRGVAATDILANEHLPIEVCYILLKVGEHAGAVCGRF